MHLHVSGVGAGLIWLAAVGWSLALIVSWCPPERPAMLRLVVVPQLVLSLLVGPMLCCCTVAQLVHGLESINPVGAGSTTKTRTCCRAVEPLHAEDPSDSHAESSGGKPRCPCEADQTKTVTIVGQGVSSTDAGLVNGFLDDLGAAFSLFDLSRLPLVGTAPAFERPDRTAFTSTSELLHAHHRLRC